MAAPAQVKQGESFTCEVDISSSTLTSPTYTLEAKQYPDDSASFSRAVTLTNEKLIITITPEETESLDIGLWWLIVKAIDIDEEDHYHERIEIKKAWL